MADSGTFEQTGQQLLESIVASLAENGVRELKPQLAIFYRDQNGQMQGAVARIDDLPADPDERQTLMAEIGKHFKASGRGQVESAFMVNEVWFSVGKDTELENVEPEEDPLRGEGISVSGMSKDGETSVSIVVIGRDRNGVMVPRAARMGGVIADAEPSLTAFFSGQAQPAAKDELVKDFFKRLDKDGKNLIL